MKSPLTNRILTPTNIKYLIKVQREMDSLPVLDCHENPAWKASIGSIRPPRTSQYAFDPIRADELDLDIASSGVCNVYSYIDVFKGLEVVRQQDFLRDHYGALQTARRDKFTARHLAGIGHRPLANLDRLGLKPSLRFEQGPILGGHDQLIRVNCTVAILVAVRTICICIFPVRVFWANHPGGDNAEVLDIPPREIGTELMGI